MDERRTRIERLRSRTQGADDEDPYESTDLDDLPRWWLRAIREFDEHDLRPYRPPRFEDGTYTHAVIDDLEDSLGICISFGSVDSNYRERWEVSIDGRTVFEVPRYRSTNGYTVYEVTSESFRDRVRSAYRESIGK